jgi:hypothetical protein
MKSLVGKSWASTISSPVYRRWGQERMILFDVSVGDEMIYTTHDGGMSIHVLTGVVFQTCAIMDKMKKKEGKI